MPFFFYNSIFFNFQRFFTAIIFAYSVRFLNIELLYLIFIIVIPRLKNYIKISKKSKFKYAEYIYRDRLYINIL